MAGPFIMKLGLSPMGGIPPGKDGRTMKRREERTTLRASDLAQKLRSEDPVIREEACKALIALGRPAVPPLVDTLSNPLDHARREAARALSRIHDPSSAPALVLALEDELPGVRWLAGEGLIAMGRGGIVPLFRALISRSDSVRLRQGAHHVLRSLSAGEHGRQLALVMEALEGPEPISALPVAAFNALKEL